MTRPSHCIGDIGLPYHQRPQQAVLAGRSRPCRRRSLLQIVSDVRDPDTDRAAGRASRPNVATPVASTGRPTAMSLAVTASLYLQQLLTATRERHDRYLYLRRLLQPRRLRCRKRKLDRLLGQARPRAARSPPRPLRHGAANGVGANTYREFAQMLANSTEESEVRDPWVTKMWRSPATVVSTTLQEPLDWPDATVVSRDAVDVVAGLKEESDVPLRSHGSLSMNRALMAAGLVDHVQVTLFPVITGQTGLN